MWQLDHKESWASKNQCFRTVMLEKTLERPLDCKVIQPIYPKGNQSWIFIGRTDAEALILWPPDAKKWLIGKELDVRKDWRQENKGMPEDEMVGRHQQLNGHEFEQTPVVDDRLGSLACCTPWGFRVVHNWATEPKWKARWRRRSQNVITLYTVFWLVGGEVTGQCHIINPQPPIDLWTMWSQSSG